MSLNRVALFGALALASCSDAADPYATFTERLNAGASCAELFELRNEVDPGDSSVREMNDALQQIGCHSSSSTRVPAP